LERSGYLEKHLEAASKNTIAAYQTTKAQLIEKGWNPNQAHWSAWELVREEWILLPDEEWERELKRR
jgi:hypothetical protein